MSIFDLHQNLILDYEKYVQSFLSIADQSIRDFVEKKLLVERALWPEALFQLNANYEVGASVSDLVKQGGLEKLCGDIFRRPDGEPITLYRHQCEAIERALIPRSFVLTSGTGSGKSLAYFIPIFNTVLREDLDQPRVRAIVVYPMNALVNSQLKSLQELAEAYTARTGNPFPITFAKYTGQESEETKARIRQNRPHILLTNYVMLELMLLRPAERDFVDRTATGLEFLVMDELHTYRGRQGADVALLVRRLRERCGNSNLVCIGTSATMVSGKGEPTARLMAVASFASKMFGVPVEPEDVIEESLKRLTAGPEPSAAQLCAAIEGVVPRSETEVLSSALTCWLELTFGVEEEADGRLRRKIPISLDEGARQLAGLTGIDVDTCRARLREFSLSASRLKRPDGSPLLAFKLHQVISQGRTVYATLEPASTRHLTLEGQYYAAPREKHERLLYPIQFCRVCGQEYYAVLREKESGRLFPFSSEFEMSSEGALQPGYLAYASNSDGQQWQATDLPAEWLDDNGRVKRDYRTCVPQSLWATPDGQSSQSQSEDATQFWFQPKPFTLCVNCGEFYTRRDKNDFRKLTGLSSEGRSTATTVLCTSVLRHAPSGGIQGAARKVLSFTDNRQDAALQSGHFNDFVQVSLLRGAIFTALAKHHELRFHDVAEKVLPEMGLGVKAVAANTDLDPDSAQGQQVWTAFRDLVEYRIYEDLRRGWRVVQPNLEQCGLLRIEYVDLDSFCARAEKWTGLDPLSHFSADERKRIVTAMLDHFRKKLALSVVCLEEMHQQQLKKRAAHLLNERWGIDQSQRFHSSTKFVLPGQGRTPPGALSLAQNSLVGRFFRREVNLPGGRDDYEQFVRKLVDLLAAQGFLRKTQQHGIESVQLDASMLFWKQGDGNAPAPDPIYSRRASGTSYAEVQGKANEFFTGFYQAGARLLSTLEGRAHTAAVRYEDRGRREDHFRRGDLSALFCSPTMELGIDIADLQLVHLRNVPPTPANYAQRSGRAGRKGDPALVVTYCAAGSGHDQYFFRKRTDMVAGAVRPPRIDLGNEDLVRAHVHAIWLAYIGLPLGRSITETLDVELNGCPLNQNATAQIQLSDQRLGECTEETARVLAACQPDIMSSGWYSSHWLENSLRRAPEEFHLAFTRWRELYLAAMSQLNSATQVFASSRSKKEQDDAQSLMREANRQRNLLCNIETAAEETDFYPYRYLASEGFLPGYNFPRLPVRAFIPRGDGEFISRSRFIALTEYAPHNMIYHEGARYRVSRLLSSPGGLEARKTTAKLCARCGYYQSTKDVDLCENCREAQNATTSVVVPLLEMYNLATRRKDRITCDEEERLRMGYDLQTCFRFAPAPDGQKRIQQAITESDGNSLLRLVYAPMASLYRINHGWRNRTDKGFLVDLSTGEFIASGGVLDDEEMEPHAAARPELLRLFVHDTQNMLLVYINSDELIRNTNLQATLQYALQRGMEQYFQVEESELASERIGEGGQRAMLFWEASQGGAGVLRRLVEERDALAQVTLAAIARCHFKADSDEDTKPDCVRACYECLLSYSNQRDHARLDRQLVHNFLLSLSRCVTKPDTQGRGYDEHYQWLRGLTDSRSELERRFIDHLFQTQRRMPDEAQRMLADYYSVPDFFYEPNVCVFCDGSGHDDPLQREKDEKVRAELRNLGYRVIVIRYDRDLEEQVQANEDVFGGGATR